MSHAWRGANRWPLQEWQTRPFKTQGVHLTLTKRQREALELSESGTPVSRIAVVMGVSEDHARRTLAEARARKRTFV